MLNSRFWNGLLAGSIVGAILVLFFSPRIRQRAVAVGNPVVRRVVGRSRLARRNARRVMDDVREGVSGIFRK